MITPQIVNRPQVTAPVVYLTTTDPVVERLIDLLDAHTSIGTVRTRDGATILTWETTCELARHIASDEQLRALICGGRGGEAA